jgi:hypothetical protein
MENGVFWPYATRMRTLVAIARSPGRESEVASVVGDAESVMDWDFDAEESTWSTRADACCTPSFHTSRLIRSLNAGAIMRRCLDQDSSLDYISSVNGAQTFIDRASGPKLWKEITNSNIIHKCHLTVTRFGPSIPMVFKVSSG